MNPVIACVDGSVDGERALRYAIEEARRICSPLRVVLVPPAPPWYTGGATAYTVAAIRGVARAQLAEIIGFAEELAPDVEIEGALPFGTRVQAIVEESRGAGCVVIGTRAPVRHHRYGSTTAGVAASAACPVVAVPETWISGTPGGRVVVGYDGSSAADLVLAVACEAARLRRMELIIVHAWRPDGPYEQALSAVSEQVWQVGAEQALAAVTAKVRAGAADVPVREVVTWSRPADALAECVGPADLLVLGRHHGHVPLVHSLGSVALGALRSGSCPVEIVPVGDGWPWASSA